MFPIENNNHSLKSENFVQSNLICAHPKERVVQQHFCLYIIKLKREEKIRLTFDGQVCLAGKKRIFICSTLLFFFKKKICINFEAKIKKKKRDQKQ